MAHTVRQSQRLKKRFLEHFRVYGNVTQAARHARIDRSSVYRWQEGDDAFAAAYREAEIEATEHLEVEARRRAVEGTERLKFDRGHAVLDPDTGAPYREREYSDTLLIFLLKARNPDKYRERVDVTFRLEDAARKLAEQFGLDPAELIAEAERIAGSRAR